MTDRRTTNLRAHGMLLLAVLFVPAGCGPARNDHYRSSLVSTPATVQPAPRPAASVPVAEPPRLEPTLYVGETPFVFRRTVPSVALGSPIENLLREAETHYQYGRLYFQEGDFDSARKEFDRAVEVLLHASVSAADRQALENKLEELVESIHRYDVSGLSTGDMAEGSAFEKPPLEDLPVPVFPIDPSQRNRILENLRATVSQLPLEANDDVLRYIQYFSSGRGRKILIAGLKRAGRYRPLIQRILDEEGVPQELIHLAQAESGFSPRAVSRAKAAGMWQFMAFRGEQYGLERTRQADYRMDPEKATRAAARHLRDLYDQFGDWHLAIAAYNCGPGTVQKAVERTGYADVWELRRRNVLPRETSSYVPVIVAMAIMAKNPKDYGLEDLETDPPLEYNTVELSAPTSLPLIADITELPVSGLRDLNPALFKSIAPKGYPLRVPKGAAGAVVSALEMIPEEQRAAWRIHRVGRGDTLATIARRYRTTPAGILGANRIASESLESGNLLVIPARLEPEPRTTKKARAASRSVARTTKAPIRTRAAKPSVSRGMSVVATRKTPTQRRASIVR